MKKIILILSLTLGTLGFSGTGHDHGDGHSHTHGEEKISHDKAKSIGKKQIERLVKAKKIDSSWLFAGFEKAETKKFKAKKEWVITYINEKGVKGKKLYIFLSLTGDFVAANFTGK